MLLDAADEVFQLRDSVKYCHQKMQVFHMLLNRRILADVWHRAKETLPRHNEVERKHVLD